MMAVRRHFLVLLSMVLLCSVREIHGRTVLTLMRQAKITSDDISANGGGGDTQEVDISSAVIDLSDDVIDLGSIDPEDITRECHGGTCNICVAALHHKACLIASATHSGFMLAVTIDGHVLFKKEIDVANPPPICLPVPFIPGLAEACVELDHVDIKGLSACVSIELKTRVFHKKIKVHIGCFTIPHIESVPMVATVEDERSVKTDVSWTDVKLSFNRAQ